MITSTIETVPGRTIAENLGVVRGTTVRSRHLGRDILAGLKGIVGGEVSEYTKLVAESREQALDRMKAEAKALGADAVIGVRFGTSMVAQGAAELLAYGTAVRFAGGRQRYRHCYLCGCFCRCVDDGLGRPPHTRQVLSS